MVLPQPFLKDIEVQYLMMLSSFLKLGQIDGQTARETARMFLTFLPFQSFEDFEAKITGFIQKYPQFQKLKIVTLKQKEEQQTSSVLEKMSTLMKENKIDEALQVTQ